jgi:hypothetical protein
MSLDLVRRMVTTIYEANSSFWPWLFLATWRLCARPLGLGRAAPALR